MEQMYITDLHLQHTEWKNTLLFYVDDIKILNHRLQEVLSKNNDKEVLAMCEHFQNQLTLQKNRAAEILHSIKESLNIIEAEVKHHPVATDHRKMELNSKLRDEVTDYSNHFNELRHEAIRFFSKWM